MRNASDVFVELAKHASDILDTLSSNAAASQTRSPNTCTQLTGNIMLLVSASTSSQERSMCAHVSDINMRKHFLRSHANVGPPAHLPVAQCHIPSGFCARAQLEMRSPISLLDADSLVVERLYGFVYVWGMSVCVLCKVLWWVLCRTG